MLNWIHYDRPKNVPRGLGHSADDFQQVYKLGSCMIWLHRFGTYNPANKKIPRSELNNQMFRMQLSPILESFGSHATHSELMALDMFQKQTQRSFKSEYTLRETNGHICAEVRERESIFFCYCMMNLYYIFFESIMYFFCCCMVNLYYVFCTDSLTVYCYCIF
jgi:hypothetical protein